MRMVALYLSLIVITFSFGKEVFTEDKIKQFLMSNNPYFQTIVIKKDIYLGKLQYYKGFFNSKLGGKYENKDYPVSYGKYRSLYIEKPTFSGIDIILGYRKAVGVQEYNNIKTGEDGEIIFGVKLPVINFLKKIDSRRTNLINTQIDLKMADFEITKKLRELYIKTIEKYYRTIYYKEILNLELQLLKKAEKRIKFIKRKVEEGSLPQILLVEANQNIIKRQERVIKAKNEFFMSLNEFLNYLNIPYDKFNKDFKLPKIPVMLKTNLKVDELYKTALKNSPNIKILKQKMKRIKNELKFISTLKYPEINFSGYVVNDFKYQQGYKFSVDFSFYPVNNKYIGKRVELSKKLIQLKNKEKTTKIELKTKISNLINKLETINQNLKLSMENINLLKKIENAEIKKFELGLSDLFYVNQREIYTLEAVKSYLWYKTDYNITYKKLILEINPYIF